MAELETDSIYSPQDITERIARANALIDSSNESLKTANTSNAVLEDTARAKEEDVVGGAELITAPSTRGAREVEELLSAKNNINNNFETEVDSLLSGLPGYSPASSRDRQYTTSVESIAPNVGEYIRNYKDNVDFNARRTQGRDPSFVVDSKNLAAMPDARTLFSNPPEMFSKEPKSNFVEMPKYPDINPQGLARELELPLNRIDTSEEGMKASGKSATEGLNSLLDRLLGADFRENYNPGSLNAFDGAPADAKPEKRIDAAESIRMGDKLRAKRKAEELALAKKLAKEEKDLADKNIATELRNEYLGRDEREKDPQAAGSGKQPFLGSDPVLGGLALAQLGAGIAQGDLGAGLSGAAKLLSDERTAALDRKSREEYYKALTNKASNSTKLAYDDAFKIASDYLREDLLTGMDVTVDQVHELAIKLIEGNAAIPVAGAEAGEPPVPGGSGSGRSDEEILNQYGIK